MSSNKPLLNALQQSMIQKVPKYGNSFFYSLGFLSMISFLVLLATGLLMIFYGPTWWLTSGFGAYVRSVHMWATQAFVLFIILHLLVVFLTSGFKKPRRLTWVIGVVMLFVVLAETEFGYVLRGDFSSQWRSLQGADFYNGAGLGHWINSLNYNQIYGIHIAIVPLAILGLLGMHYLLVRVLGIAKPYRADVKVQTVDANHTKLFIRGGVLVVLVVALAWLLPSPYIKPTTISFVAQQDPMLFGKTVVAEIDGSSDTKTYVDNIAPYTYDTKQIYVVEPYNAVHELQSSGQNVVTAFNAEPESVQSAQLAAAADYYDGKGKADSSNPVEQIVAELTSAAQAGLYESYLAAQPDSTQGFGGQTYVARFLSDTGVLEDQATAISITTDQYGMVREEKGYAPGAWWLTPIGLLNHTVLANDDNGDRDAAIIFGSLLLTMIAFPFIPYVNQLPDKLGVHKYIWLGKKASKK